MTDSLLMDCKSTNLPFKSTNSFSKISMDYLVGAEKLISFYTHQPDLKGIENAVAARMKFATDREALVQTLKSQYQNIKVNSKVEENLQSLLSPSTFTVTTAHQNNIFTGPLYFIYKIIHAIKIADELNGLKNGRHFVPVYYIGSEDADLEELNHIYSNNEKYVWQTSQKGAVGRMIIDKKLVQLIDKLEGQLGIFPNGNEIIKLLRLHYREGEVIKKATFEFVDELFGSFGLVILEPDTAVLKKQMYGVFEKDLLFEEPSMIVGQTATQLEKAGYKVQAHPRAINLFYLNNGLRERIEKINNRWEVIGTGISFSSDEILQELKDFPERFSPNVILRGLYQETILPNIAFVGGAGETAYWLQLKELFEHYQVPFPVLFLRNSFMLVEEKWKRKITSLGLEYTDLFNSEDKIVEQLVLRDSKNNFKTDAALKKTESIFNELKNQAGSIDVTLLKHIESLKEKTKYRLEQVEKKMIRAEKRKFSEQRSHIHKIRDQFFPSNGLQERKENLSYYYARWGKDFLSCLYKNSPGIQPAFIIVELPA